MTKKISLSASTRKYKINPSIKIAAMWLGLMGVSVPAISAQLTISAPELLDPKNPSATIAATLNIETVDDSSKEVTLAQCNTTLDATGKSQCTLDFGKYGSSTLASFVGKKLQVGIQAVFTRNGSKAILPSKWAQVAPLGYKILEKSGSFTPDLNQGTPLETLFNGSMVLFYKQTSDGKWNYNITPQKN
jgi:hypothetical protein